MKVKIRHQFCHLILICSIFFFSCKEEGPKIITLTDIDNNTYKAITIGNQVWMAENLRTTRYRNGESIKNVTDNTEWIGQTSGAYCTYDNDQNKGNIYGKLYNWYAVTDNRNIAPEGWHVPSVSEWETLITKLGGRAEAAGKMKEKGTTHWLAPNPTINESGFNALPGGWRVIFEGRFNYLGMFGCFWTRDKYTDINATTFGLYYPMQNEYMGTASNPAFPAEGMSIRCIKE